MTPSSRKRLEDVVRRSEHVERLSYFYGKDNVVGADMRQVDGQWHAEFHQPSDEQRDSLLFNARLFVQNKDDLSFQRLVELYDDPGISDGWKREHGAIRTELNRRLEEVAADGPKGALTHQNVLNMFLYGELGHRDEDDRDYGLFQRWVTDSTERELLHNTFHTVLTWLAVAIINVGRISKRELHGVGASAG